MMSSRAATSPSPLLPAATEQCTACGAEMDVSGLLPLAEVNCPACGSRIRVLQQFGDLTIRERLGQGGMGAVYRAFDPTLQREMALKLLRAEFSRDESQLAQLETEALIMASISHPNVVRVFSIGHERGLSYISMEVVEHGCLAALLKRDHQLPEEHLLRIALDAAQGLSAVYATGLIHRDVKPGNILFDASGRAKIVDFGLATAATAQQTDGEVFGSPFYLSPERVTGVQEDFRSDIYSLGATLYQAAAGRPPFDAPTPTQVAMKHAESRAPKLRTYAPHISSLTASIIDRMLQRERESRYQSYQELLAELTYAQNQQGVAAVPVSASWRSISGEDDKQQALWTWLITGMLAIALLGGAAFFLWPKDKEEMALAPRPEDEIDRFLNEPKKVKATPAPVAAAAVPKPQTAPAARPMAGGLVHEFDFENVSGEVSDTTGGVTLKLLKGAKLVTGGISGNRCLEVSSAAGSKAAIFMPDGGLRTTAGVPGITLAAWIKPMSYPPKRTPTPIRAAVVSVLAGGDATRAAADNAKFMTRSNFSIGDSGELVVTIRKGDTDPSSATGAPAGSIPLDEWRHVVVAVDYAASNAERVSVKIFINGEAVQSRPITRPLAQGKTTANSPSFGIVIGSNRADETASEQFDGLIDKVQIYNKALTTEEAQGLYSRQAR